MISKYFVSEKRELIGCTIICGLITFLFYILTYQNNWHSDDYPYIFGTKLFNLINEQQFYLFETDKERLRPAYWFIVQFIPSSYQLWHFFIVIIYFLSSIINFFVIYKISNNKKLSLLSSILFTLNFSLSLKSLTWGVFFGHIFNVFIGLTLVLIFINILSQKKFKFLLTILFIFLNLLNLTITEGAAVYLFINFVILLFWKKKLNISKNLIIFLNFLPIFLYLFFSFLNSGKFIPTLQERLDIERNTYYQKLFNYNDENNIYFYRSTYAPRDFKGYSLRLIENLAGSFNFSLLENSIKTLDQESITKSFIKDNFLILTVSLSLISIFFIFYLTKQIKLKKNISEYYFYITLFVTVILIYNFIFFRKDINLALAFSGSLLLAKILLDLFKFQKKILFFFLISLYSFPSILSFIVGFNYYGDFKTTDNQKLSKKYANNLNIKKDQNLLIQEDFNFKYYYYFKNFDRYKNDLKIYKSKKLEVFFSNFYLNK